MFEFLIKKLKAHPRKIVFTEGTDPRILEAAARLLSGTFLTPVLVGNPDEIAAAANEIGFNIRGAEIRDPENFEDWETLVERRAPQLIANTYPFFSVDTLEYLMKGGRIGKVTATAGTLLQIKPIITFAPDGQLQSVAKVRGRNQVIDKLVAITADRRGSHKRYNLAVANGGAPAEMELVRQKLTAALPHYDHIWDGEIDGTLSGYNGDVV